MKPPDKPKKSIPKPTNFGANLKFLRRLNGHSQAFLAKELGIKRNNIASYESGVVEPKAEVFLKFCEYYSRPPVEVLETVISNKGLDAIAGSVPEMDVVDQYFADNLEKFIQQTNDMTKVVEGYKAYIELKYEKDMEQSTKSLLATLSEYVDLFETLLKSNWNIIGKIVPDRNQTE